MGNRLTGAIYLTVAAVFFSACSGGQQEARAPSTDDPQVAAGFDLVRSSGCLSCHSVGATARSGPSFVGLAGSTVTLQDGSSVTVDDEYLKRALTDPAAQVRKGYSADPMQRVVASRDLTPQQIESVVAYIKELE